jgi:hypothetical protein
MEVMGRGQEQRHKVPLITHILMKNHDQIYASHL